MQTNQANIIIVEDERDILDLLTYNLTREGYAVTGFSDGEQALRGLPLETPSLILLDLMLPGANGLEICRLLKAKPETAGIPVIMVTAKGEEADVVRGLEIGADDYIAKPFSMKVLLARIQTALRRREQKPVQTDESLKDHDVVINLLRQVESGLLTRMLASR